MYLYLLLHATDTRNVLVGRTQISYNNSAQTSLEMPNQIIIKKVFIIKTAWLSYILWDVVALILREKKQIC